MLYRILYAEMYLDIPEAWVQARDRHRRPHAALLFPPIAQCLLSLQWQYHVSIGMSDVVWIRSENDWKKKKKRIETMNGCVAVSCAFACDVSSSSFDVDWSCDHHVVVVVVVVVMVNVMMIVVVAVKVPTH